MTATLPWYDRLLTTPVRYISFLAIFLLCLASAASLGLKATGLRGFVVMVPWTAMVGVLWFEIGRVFQSVRLAQMIARSAEEARAKGPPWVGVPFLSGDTIPPYATFYVDADRIGKLAPPAFSITNGRSEKSVGKPTKPV